MIEMRYKKKKIKANNVDVKLFTAAKAHIFNKLKNDIFPHFIESGLYNVKLVDKNNPNYCLMPKKFSVPKSSSFLSVSHDTVLDIGKMVDDIKKLQEERDELREVNEHLNTYIDELYAEFLVSPRSIDYNLQKDEFKWNPAHPTQNSETNEIKKENKKVEVEIKKRKKKMNLRGYYYFFCIYKFIMYF